MRTWSCQFVKYFRSNATNEACLCVCVWAHLFAIMNGVKNRTEKNGDRASEGEKRARQKMAWILAPKNEHKRWRTSNYFYDFYVCVHAPSIALCSLSPAPLDWDTSAGEWNLFNTKLIHLVSCISVHSLTNTHTHTWAKSSASHPFSKRSGFECTWMAWALTKPANFILFYILTRSIIIFPELYTILNLVSQP